MPIRRLPADLVNLIAAGEVIERPASVVKELVENSLDAGATNVEVEVLAGGRDLISVADDGRGIPIEELPLALAQHATSKLQAAGDLEAIETFGFRGEALASIGAVSHLAISSRVEASDTGWEIRCQGSHIGEAQACRCARGTRIEVRNLFFNTPARRKFLKTEATEFGHIHDTLTRLAMAHPDAGFSLKHDGRLICQFTPQELLPRLRQVFPEEVREQLIEIDGRDAELRVVGLASPPTVRQNTARYQYFFVNGRNVRDRTLQHGLREAYRGVLDPGSQPYAAILIEMPPGDVDVNVHPAKAEVRFRESSRLHSLVYARVRDRVATRPSDPTLETRAVADATEHARQQLAQHLLSLGPQAGGLASQPVQPSLPQPQPQSQSSTLPPGRLEASAPATSGTPLVQSAPEGVNAIQLHNSYLVMETPEGMLIVDQHALHERVIYERLLGLVQAGTLESQRLLLPLVVPMSPKQVALAESLREVLHRLGVEIAVFGPDSVGILSFPTFLKRLDPVAFVRQVVEAAESRDTLPATEEIMESTLQMMACKAAVKAGDSLTDGEVSDLLAHRQLVDRAGNCPHGRPTGLKLTLKDLEKQFKRTGF